MASKKAAAPAPAEEIQIAEAGDFVTFNGYSEAPPDGDIVLEEGTAYEVESVNAEEESYVVLVPNPDFDTKKKVSKTNPENLKVDVFFEEATIAEAEEEEAPAPKAKSKAAPASKGKAKAAAPAEEPEETPAPKAKAKAPTKAAAKAPAKAESKGKAAAKVAATTKAAQSEDAGEPELDNEDEDILALIEATDNILELAAELIEESAATDYRIGGVLYHIRNEKSYEVVDKAYKQPGGFEAYINEHLGIEYRKAMYLIDIYYKFNLFGISGEKVAEMGWTKAKEIARIMTEDNAEELVELANSSTVADLKDTIKEDFVGTGTKGSGEEKAKRITFKFRLFEDQAAGVQEVLERAAEVLGYSKLDDAFEHILTEWAAEHLDVAPQKKAARGKK